MKKILFFNIPAHGHTNPTLNVVRELVAQGHKVWYYSYESFRKIIEETGAVFISCDNYDRQLKLTPKQTARLGKDLALSTSVLADTTIALGEHIERDLLNIQPDCIVSDSMAIWGKAMAKKHHIPFVSSTTTFAFNQHSSKLMKRSFPDLMCMLISMPRINTQLKRLQNHGYPFKSILDILQNGNDTHTIVYTSRTFQPCSDTFSDKYAFVGPSVRPSRLMVDKIRTKLIYISMGTVDNQKLPLYRHCVQSLADSDYQVIISAGNQIPADSFPALPEHISIYPTVDQIAVLEKADVFLTHCGMNSVSEGLYFGVPLLMLPQTPEQWAVARRVLQLNAGILLEKTDPASIRCAVEYLLSQPVYQENARMISESFRSAPGAKGAVQKILSICNENNG